MNELQHYIDLFYGLPGYVIVIIVCLCVGYGLKAIKAFPNKAIPLVCILIGGGLNMLLRGDEPAGMRHRIWMVENMALGIVVGFITWQLHFLVLKKLEAKVPFVKEIFPDDETKSINKPDDTK